MRSLLIAVMLLAIPAMAQEKVSDKASREPCLIVKHASGFSAFENNANWEYVAGDFPKDMKWKGHLTDRNIRQIKAKGWPVQILGANEEVAQAQKRCTEAR